MLWHLNYGGLKMIYLVDCQCDVNKLQWCKDNGIFYLKTWYFLTFMVLFLPNATVNRWLTGIIIFNTEDAMAFKLRWE